MQQSDYRYRLARRDELLVLQEIEGAASLLFRDTPFPEIAKIAPLPLHVLRQAQEQGHIWVVTQCGDRPVGFAIMRIVEDVVHLHELDVHPDHGQRGLGRQLVEQICSWAAERGYAGVTLSTFRTIPWNAPFYERLGFRVLNSAELSPGLHEIVDEEAAAGLPIEQRVIMRRELNPTTPPPDPRKAL